MSTTVKLTNNNIRQYYSSLSFFPSSLLFSFLFFSSLSLNHCLSCFAQHFRTIHSVSVRLHFAPIFVCIFTVVLYHAAMLQLSVGKLFLSQICIVFVLYYHQVALRNSPIYFVIFSLACSPLDFDFHLSSFLPLPNPRDTLLVHSVGHIRSVHRVMIYHQHNIPWKYIHPFILCNPSKAKSHYLSNGMVVLWVMGMVMVNHMK